MSTDLPTVDDVASDPLVHRHGDFFAPPGLTNFLGAAQVDNDLFALRSITFPPFGSLGHTITARGYLDGRLVTAYGAPVTFTWRPDRVTRTATLGGLDVRTTTVLPPGESAAVVEIEISNPGPVREVTLKLGFDASVTHALRPWNAAEAPGEWDNERVRDDARARMVFRARHSDAVSVQGLDTSDCRLTHNGVEVVGSVAAGGSWRVAYVHAVGGSVEEAQATYDRVAADVPASLAAAEALWNREIAAMFTPGNESFSGSLPWLETTNGALRKVYALGAVGMLYHRRDSPANVLGRAYETLMPRYWQTLTCIWETSLSSLAHALLDPDVLRRHLEHWMTTDVHTHFGTERLTGATMGNWYSVNDYALSRLVRDLVSWSGDEEWLRTSPADGRTVADHVHGFATAYRALRRDHGLADYGGDINTFLECVSTYNHAIAALNAGAVFALRAAADMADVLGDTSTSMTYREEASSLAEAVKGLYEPGGGFFNVRHPDGSLVPVRHCYDFITVPRAMGSDLTDEQRTEMTEFFVRELQTPVWMHALSPYDDDALFSVRPDHQWNGAFPAWPSEAVAALYELGAADVAAAWLPGLARSANQGPFGQAQFAEVAYEPDSGGARKAPADFPWINDWADSSTGSYVSMVIEAMFGVQVGWDGTVTASPRLAEVDPDARLRGLVVRGRTYDVDAEGLHPTTPVDPQQDPL